MLGMLPFYAKYFPIKCRQPPVSSSIIQLLIIMASQWTETIRFSFAFTPCYNHFLFCFITVDYFHKECYDVCMRRLEVLMDSNLDICAYNFTIFLIKRVFDPQNEFLEKDWLHGKRDNAYNILDLHLAILYKRKEDSSKLQYLVSILNFHILINGIFYGKFLPIYNFS